MTRAPRIVWINWSNNYGIGGVYKTKKEAVAAKWEDEIVTGPYILAERVATK